MNGLDHSVTLGVPCDDLHGMHLPSIFVAPGVHARMRAMRYMQSGGSARWRDAR